MSANRKKGKSWPRKSASVEKQTEASTDCSTFLQKSIIIFILLFFYVSRHFFENGRTSCRLAAGAPMFAIRRPCLVDLFAICATFAGEPRQTQRLTRVPVLLSVLCTAVQMCASLVCRKLNQKLLEKDENENENGNENGSVVFPNRRRRPTEKRLNVQINVHTNYTTILKIGLFVGLWVYLPCLRWLGAICVHWLVTCVLLIVPKLVLLQFLQLI